MTQTAHRPFTARLRSSVRYWQVFQFGALIAATFLLIYMIRDGGPFLFYGDFNVQQIPFYIEANRAVRSGMTGWNPYTDLGVNFIGSYSFYLLGSPFFWLTTLLPLEYVGYSLGFLYILKFACASLTAYLYLERFVQRKEYAMIGAFLYAFSGWGIYNIFFNHFHEALVFFPLLLLGIEKYMKDGSRGVFAFAVFVNAIVNYYFFFGEVIFCLIYFFLRCLSDDWELSLGKLGGIALEAVIGLGMSAILLVPSIYSVLDNPRTSSTINGWNALMYSPEQRYGLIIESFFFPPDIPARPNFFPDSDSKWASTAGWLPLFSMTGVIAYLQSRKKDWLKRIIYVCIFMAMIPFLNSLFSAMNYGYYSRWFYMPILMMALATIISLDREDINWARGFRRTAFITLFITFAIGFTPASSDPDPISEEKLLYTSLFILLMAALLIIGLLVWMRQRFEAKRTPLRQRALPYVLTILGVAVLAAGLLYLVRQIGVELGVYAYTDRFFLYVFIALVSLFVCGLLLFVMRRSHRWFTPVTLIALTLVIAIYANVFICIGRAHSFDRSMIKNTLIDQTEGIDLPDQDKVRVDVLPGSMDNLPMFWGLQTIQAFHSVVPSSIMDFYESVGVERGVASRPEWSHQGLRALLSVRWLIDPDNDSVDEINQYSGWRYDHEVLGYGIYENENYIPMGFTYDQFITLDGWEACAQSSREKLLLHAILLDDTQVEKYKDILQLLPLCDEDLALEEQLYGAQEDDSEDWMPDIGDYIEWPGLYDEAIAQACADRRAGSCYEFAYDNGGFTAKIQPEHDNLVFFSVPWDADWSATVNGEPVEIERVNVGFMAVRVTGGIDNVIRFEYRTPGLIDGITVSGLYIPGGVFISAGSAVVFVGYLITCALLRRRRRKMAAQAQADVQIVTAEPLPFGQTEAPADPGTVSPQEDDDPFFPPLPDAPPGYPSGSADDETANQDEGRWPPDTPNMP